MLAVGSLMSAATAFRVGVGYVILWSAEAPRLLDLWLKAGEATAEADEAGRTLRDELLRAARYATNSVNNELLRGIDDVDRFTERRPTTGS
jgi:polyhydroxyalkanoate synthesis regulator phasin